MDKTEIAEKVALTVVTIGVGRAVSNVLNDAAPEDANGLTKAVTWIGGAVIVAMIVDKAYDYMKPVINEAISYVNKVIVDIKNS